ncbi:septation protein SepH [Nocardioides sp. R-C-SC26]|uniref:septation protein SepH n=1 Tax=Nocardioides sp. R-C-SC26 TaxID=2870414 RepID=UPI001E564389|nr:septation protein SepH [Nocardioides sp. R-C-SC26]
MTTPAPLRAVGLHPASSSIVAGVTADEGGEATILLVDDHGNEYSLTLTRDVRALLGGAVAGSPGTSRPSDARTRPRETFMDSTLRPRDIQARIRSGESAETVAQAAGTSVEAIMPFVAPVLAERAHVSERAQRATVRRPAGDTSQARTLGDSVETRLRPLNVAPDAVEWDAWRREDGRWSLVAQYSSAERSGIAELTFDMPGNYVVLENDDARWLVGDAVTAPAPLRDDLENLRQRRLTTVGVDPADADGQLDLVDLAEAETVTVRDPAASEEIPLGADRDVWTASERRTVADQTGTMAPAADLGAAEPASPEQSEATTEGEDVRRPAPKKRGRPSVPSWDEIMFGGGDR